MTVTSADEEKLLLLNRNTDLRRLNKELMKLNEEWDHIYRSTTMGLQEKISSLQQEVVGLNQHNERLIMKLEHEQSKREYYEQTLLQELRKNQHLQEYVRHLEGKIHRSSSSSTASERPAGVLNGVEVCEGLYEFPSQHPRVQYKGSSHSPPPLEPPGNGDRKQGNPRQGRSKQDSATLRSFKGQSDMLKEVQELKDQLETLKCQNGVEVCRPPEVCEGLCESPSQPPRMQYKGSSHSPPPLEPPGNGNRKQGNPRQGRSKQDSATLRSFKGQSDMLKEVQELKDQLETLKCQTRIYEADYKTEHKDRERMKNENSKLRRKEEELRQQMALQQEQGYMTFPYLLPPLIPTGVPALDPEELERATEGFSRLEREFGLEYAQYSLHNVHLKYRWVMSLAIHPKVLEPIKGILGPNVILLDSRFICKYPIKQKSHEAACESQKPVLPYVAWHQDIRYWGFEGGSVASVWLALDDVDRENGVLQVIPGSHHQGLLPHITSPNPGNMLTANQEIPEHLLNTSEAVECPLQAGQMSVHDGLTVHGSEPNLSTRRRCGFVIRYVPTSAYPVQVSTSLLRWETGGGPKAIKVEFKKSGDTKIS
ncbi:UNVERIFIED_CONTAM: hypothetical protein FKN15_025473 [Acipenser sinensis]